MRGQRNNELLQTILLLLIRFDLIDGLSPKELPTLLRTFQIFEKLCCYWMDLVSAHSSRFKSSDSCPKDTSTYIHEEKPDLNTQISRQTNFPAHFKRFHSSPCTPVFPEQRAPLHGGDPDVIVGYFQKHDMSQLLSHFRQLLSSKGKMNSNIPPQTGTLNDPSFDHSVACKELITPLRLTTREGDFNHSSIRRTMTRPKLPRC